MPAPRSSRTAEPLAPIRSRRPSSLARRIVRQRRWIALGWTLAAAALLPLAARAERDLEVAARVDGSESAVVEELLDRRFASPFARFAVLIASGVPAPDRPDGERALQAITAALAADSAAAGTFSWLDARDDAFVPSSGRGTFVVVGLGDHAPPDVLIRELRRTSGRLQQELRRTHPDATLRWTGEAALNFDLRAASAADAEAAEARVLPLTLLLLLLAFGAVTAALLPIGAGVLSIIVALGLAVAIALRWPLSILLQNVISMLGLGLGIDYALLTVSRFREAMAAGLAPEEAAVDAADHAGHTIAVSGIAVSIGFAALLVVPLSELRAIAVGGLLVTAVSVLVATTLLPGVLAWLGGRVGRPGQGIAARLAGRFRGARREARIVTGDPVTVAGATTNRWTRWGFWVGRHPLLVLAVAGIPLIALGAQARRIDTDRPRGDWLPREMESAIAVRELGAMGRSGIVNTTRIVIDLPPGVSALDPTGWRATEAVASRVAADQRVAEVRSLPTIVGGSAPNPVLLMMVPDPVRRSFVSTDERAAIVEVVPREGIGPREVTAMAREWRAALRTVVDLPPGTRLLVGGLPAFNVDYQDAVAGRLPLVVGLVLGGTLIVLFIAFRSVLVALKAVVLNLLSVVGAFGAVVLVFQDGIGASMLGVTAADGLFPAVPILVFCIVFGLSMDYEVFLIARVAEARRGGADDATALAVGLARTGGVITSAAAIMIVVFAAFTLGEFLLMQMLGFALAAAVLLDATVVRVALGPALLRLAGRWNWWPGERAHASLTARAPDAAVDSAQGKPSPTAEQAGA